MHHQAGESECHRVGRGSRSVEGYGPVLRSSLTFGELGGVPGVRLVVAGVAMAGARLSRREPVPIDSHVTKRSCRSRTYRQRPRNQQEVSMMSSTVAGVDPHQDTFTVAVIDVNGSELTHETFDNRSGGYRAAIELLTAHGVEHVGVEGSASWGSHVAVASVAAGFDAREHDRWRGRPHGDQRNMSTQTSTRGLVRGRCNCRTVRAGSGGAPAVSRSGISAWWVRSQSRRAIRTCANRSMTAAEPTLSSSQVTSTRSMPTARAMIKLMRRIAVA